MHYNNNDDIYIKYIINKRSIIICIPNVIMNYEMKKDKVIRKDYVTKSLIQKA